MREDLLTRMIHIYGFEHKAVIEFAKLMETEISDHDLETIIKAHEEFPIVEDEEEDF